MCLFQARLKCLQSLAYYISAAVSYTCKMFMKRNSGQIEDVFKFCTYSKTLIATYFSAN
jgi:hypothetical protein